MIRHIVFWNLKEHALGQDKETNYRLIKEKLESLEGELEGLRRVHVGRNITPGGYDACLYAECDSRQALERYQSHPAHLKIKEFVHQVIESRALCDVEMVEE